MSRRAVILAGGLGSRLRPYTTVIPKPLMPLGEHPIMEVVLRQLARQGFTHVDLCIGYLGHLIRAFFGDGSSLGIAISYQEEKEPLGTIGALALLPDVAAEDSLLVMNGDILTDLDFGAVLDRHEQSGRDATICITRRTVEIDFGVIDVTPEGTLAAYHEKPTSEVFVSIGVNVVRGSAIRAITPGERLDAPDFMRRLTESGRPVGCHVVEDFWLDLGRISDYQAAADMVAAEPGRFLP